MALAQNKIYTIEDIYALPEGTRAELIDGQIYYMAQPSRKHQDISGEFLQLSETIFAITTAHADSISHPSRFF